MARDYIKKAALNYQATKAKTRIIFLVIIFIVLGIVLSFISFLVSSGAFDNKKVAHSKFSSVTTMTEPEIKENILIGLQNKITKMTGQIDTLTGKLTQDFNKQIGNNLKEMEQKVDIQAQYLKEYQKQQSNNFNRLSQEIEKTNDKLGILKKHYKALKNTMDTGLTAPPPLLVSSQPSISNKSSSVRTKYLPPAFGENNHPKEQPLIQVKEKKIIKKEEVLDKSPILKQYFVQTLTNDIQVNDEVKEEKNVDEEKKDDTYNVAIGFGKGYMITGAYGPLFGSSPLGDVPVLIEAQKSILIPNDYSEDIDKCFLIGGGIGDPATNSVLIRLTDIQCIFNDKKKQIHGSITGWVLGKDGKPGVKGKLISKSGQYIWRMVMSGAVQGFASSSSSSATPIILNTTGTTNSGLGSILAGTASGGATGMGKAFDKLSDFYLKMAEKTLPVIEVNGGQTVNIFLKGGEKLKVDDFNSIDVPLLDEYYSMRDKGE